MSTVNEPGGAAPELTALTPAAANTRLATLSADKSWSEKFLSGDVATRREFDELTRAAANVGDEQSLDIGPQPMMETTFGDELPTRSKIEAITSFREAGLSDGAILQAMKGGKVTRAEHDAVRRHQAARHGDREWVSKFLAGDYAARRESLLHSIVLSSEIEG